MILQQHHTGLCGMGQDDRISHLAVGDMMLHVKFTLHARHRAENF